MTEDLQTLAINTIRTLAMDAVQKANSGHPGLPMGAAPMAYALWMRHLRHNPRTRTGPTATALSSAPGMARCCCTPCCYLTGYDLLAGRPEELPSVGQQDPRPPGIRRYPRRGDHHRPTGQGAANAVGLALAEAYLAKYFNRDGYNVVDHYTYALVSDGDLQEGISAEASSLAGSWGLGKLIFLYDNNHIHAGWPDRHGLHEDVRQALSRPTAGTLSTSRTATMPRWSAPPSPRRERVTDKPTLISVHTTIGYGSPNKAGTSSAHGSPLGAEEVKLTKEALGWPQEDFYVPGDALEHFREAMDTGRGAGTGLAADLRRLGAKPIPIWPQSGIRS